MPLWVLEIMGRVKILAMKKILAKTDNALFLSLNHISDSDELDFHIRLCICYLLEGPMVVVLVSNYS